MHSIFDRSTYDRRQRSTPSQVRHRALLDLTVDRRQRSTPSQVHPSTAGSGGIGPARGQTTIRAQHTAHTTFCGIGPARNNSPPRIATNKATCDGHKDATRPQDGVLTLQPLFRVWHTPHTTAYVPPRVVKQAPSSLAHVDQFRRACQIRVGVAERKRNNVESHTARAAGVGSVPTTGVSPAPNHHALF